MFGFLGNLFGRAGTAIASLASRSPTAESEPRSPGSLTSGFSAQPAPLDRDALVATTFPQPWNSPLDLDNFGAETDEMRRAYLELYRREPSIKSAIEGKVASIAALDVAVMPRRGNVEIDRQAADFVKWTVASTGQGWDGLIRDIALPALLLGWSITEPTLRVIDDDPEWAGRWGLLHCKSKDTRYLRLQLDQHRNVTGVVNLIRGAENIVPGKVIRFTNLELFSNPFGGADLRSAYRSANLIHDAYKLWYVILSNTQGPFLVGRYSNRHMPFSSSRLRTLPTPTAHSFVK